MVLNWWSILIRWSWLNWRRRKRRWPIRKYWYFYSISKILRRSSESSDPHPQIVWILTKSKNPKLYEKRQWLPKRSIWNLRRANVWWNHYIVKIKVNGKWSRKSRQRRISRWRRKSRYDFSQIKENSYL